MGTTTQGAAHDTMPEVGQGTSLSENAEIQNNNRQEGGREGEASAVQPMRRITHIIVHCSATPEGCDVSSRYRPLPSQPWFCLHRLPLGGTSGRPNRKRTQRIPRWRPLPRPQPVFHRRMLCRRCRCRRPSQRYTHAGTAQGFTALVERTAPSLP